MAERFAVTGAGRASLSKAGASGPIVHGVLLGDNETTEGQHGRKYWPGREQRKAAESLVGAEFSFLHENDAVATGTVTRAGYKEGVGTVYEASLSGANAEEIAEKIASGDLATSLEATVDSMSQIDYDDDGAQIFRDYNYRRVAAIEGNPAASANYNAAGSIDQNPSLAAALQADDADDVITAALEEGHASPVARKRQVAREAGWL